MDIWKLILLQQTQLPWWTLPYFQDGNFLPYDTFVKKYTLKCTKIQFKVICPAMIQLIKEVITYYSRRMTCNFIDDELNIHK